MPYFVCFFFVQVISDKESARHFIFYTDTDFACITGFTFVAVRIENNNIVEITSLEELSKKE